MLSDDDPMTAGGPISDARPNLLFAFADQLRACSCGCYGNDFVRTPTLDAMAREGLTVGRCYANTPVCGPMRASMWTGLYATQHGAIANDLAAPTDAATLARQLSADGYRVGYIGKWHLDGVPRRKFTPPGERRLGFDDFWAAFNCAHEYFSPFYYRDSEKLIKPIGYEPQVQTELACEFLDASRDDDRPFALVVSYGPPHDPYPQVPPEYRDLYDPGTIPLRPNVEPDADNPLAKGLECRRTLADYHAAVTALDDQLARLLARLDANGQAGNTVVAYGSDHGDMLWSHGLLKKQAPYEESVHVPLVLRGPGVPARRDNVTMMGLVDLTPTLLGLLGVDVPSSMTGRDLSAALRGEAEGPDAVLLSNPLSSDEAGLEHLPEWRGLRTRTHTYVETSPGEAWLLFDDEADPHQLRNLADDPAAASLRGELSSRLRAKLECANDPFLPGQAMLEHFGLAEAWRERNARMFA